MKIIYGHLMHQRILGEIFIKDSDHRSLNRKRGNELIKHLLFLSLLSYTILKNLLQKVLKSSKMIESCLMSKEYWL